MAWSQAAVPVASPVVCDATICQSHHSSIINAAAKTGDAAEINHLAHKLAGSSLACGMNAAAPLLRQLEHNAREGRTDGAAETLAQTAKCIESMRGEAQACLANYKR